MKNLKGLLIVLLSICVLLLSSGCDNSEKRIKIGILQYLEIEALSNARRGFIDGLAAVGYINGDNIDIELLNPEKDYPTMSLQAKKLVRNSDLILAIATPAANAILNEAKDQEKDTPILFTAVTDPVSAMLIESNEFPGGNVTGTNDMNPIKEQIGLVKKLVPNAKSIGILYTSSETNSEIQANIAKVEAEKLGLTVHISTIDTINDLQLVASALAKKVDAIYIPTDNAIAGAMGVINEVVLQEKIPAIAGEINSVIDGGSITYGIDYYNLGFQTAQMAISILRDKLKPSEIPSIGLEEFKLVINKKQLDLIGVEIPTDLLQNAILVADLIKE
ncbi:MAG TPA: ABC transporter substrate-binding protein [Acholeplasmataceae bacterium]|nr:ABC transporter substrate-binding protein [Acholeplasmataceae bacterium]